MHIGESYRKWWKTKKNVREPSVGISMFVLWLLRSRIDVFHEKCRSLVESKNWVGSLFGSNDSPYMPFPPRIQTWFLTLKLLLTTLRLFWSFFQQKLDFDHRVLIQADQKLPNLFKTQVPSKQSASIFQWCFTSTALNVEKYIPL